MDSEKRPANSKEAEKLLVKHGKADYQFDDLLVMTGGFGRYQIALYTFICLVSIPTGAQLTIPVFYAISPPFTCASVSGNATCTEGECCSSCVEYEFKGTFTSAVSEWDLICDRRHLRAMTRAVFMVGLLVGAFVFSGISDYFGRKLSFFMSFGFLAVCGVVSAVADCLSLFSLFRFFAGAGTIGCILVRFVYCVEMVVTVHRSWVAIINMMFLAVGASLLCLLAYLIPNWRYLMLAVSLPGFLPLVAWWWIPRTPRWLIANNHLEEAHEVLMKYAAGNGVTVDPANLKHVIQEVRKGDARRATETKKYGILDVIRTPKLRKRTLIMFFNWNVNSIIYYGINYNVHNLAGNVYLNLFLLVMVNFPQSVISCFCLKRFGRRLTYSVYMLLAGVFCLLALAVPTNKDYQAAVVTFVMFAKLCVIGSFSIIYLYTAELYPTVIRNNAVGACSTVARIGGIITPYIVLLSDLPNLRKTFPLLILGVLGVAAGIMAFWLPETITSQMAQTVEQAEAWDEDYKIYCCKKPQIHAPRVQELEMEANNLKEGEGKEKEEEISV
ncbi:organic cation transporter protein-like [Oculina patagonica]